MAPASMESFDSWSYFWFPVMVVVFPGQGQPCFVLWQTNNNHKTISLRFNYVTTLATAIEALMAAFILLKTNLVAYLMTCFLALLVKIIPIRALLSYQTK